MTNGGRDTFQEVEQRRATKCALYHFDIASTRRRRPLLNSGFRHQGSAMPITIQDSGSDNVIDVDPYTLETGNGAINIGGSKHHQARAPLCRRYLAPTYFRGVVRHDRRRVRYRQPDHFARHQGRVRIAKAAASTAPQHPPSRTWRHNAGRRLPARGRRQHYEQRYAQHPRYGNREKDQLGEGRPIGDRVWIGAEANILKAA